MKKNIQKFTSSILLIALLFCFTLSTYARDAVYSDTRSLEEAYLKTLGVTQDYLDLISDEKVHSMYESFSPKSRTTNDITYEWGGYKTFEKEMNDSTPNAKGTISTAKLRLTVGYMNELSGTKIQGVTLEISYKWLSLPAFLNEDAITVNWDSNIFNSDGFYSDMGGEFIKGRYESFKFTTSPNKLASGGIGWTVPIVSGYHPGEKPVSIYGGGSIHLYPTSSIYTTSGRACQFILEYTHFYLSLTGGLNFSITGPSVSVSPSSGSDNLFSQYKWQSNVSYGAN